MKRKAGIFVIIILILIGCIGIEEFYEKESEQKQNENKQVEFINKQNDNNNVQITKLDLLEKLKDYREFSIDIINAKNNIVYGTIEDTRKNKIVFSTVAVFYYNISNGKINIIPQNDDKRIIDFAVIDKMIYYCYLMHQEDDTFKWNIVMENLTTKEVTEISKGTVNASFEYPRIFATEKDTLYIMTKSKNIAKISVIEGKKIEDIKVIDGIKVSTYNMDSITYNDGKIYYVSTEKNGKDSLRVITLKKQEELLYECKSDMHIIYTFNVLKEKIVIQEIIEQEKSKLITLQKSNNKIEQTVETNLLTFQNSVNEDTILFHISDASWIKYSVSKNNFHKLEFLGIENENIFPKYFVVETDKILLQDFNNDFYVVKIY